MAKNKAKTRLTKTELLSKLRSLPGIDPEQEHSEADKALLAYINDAEISRAYNALTRYYA